ncbi:unnamed protein product [Didymodactylos carnosus]|uniref:G-protein coupled receptors family 1 profile domain-containing protein n=1 Tax=Didymodactylos carnosus TaxID=1234261 RepID=A0A8S2TJP3_9BILA|nr:unnamed protein product [Didymodactylos carnosus]CAF4285556.1 unnamed protein product [Didymodactylos carnosus]
MSIYLLVAMSFDRYLAVVRAMDSIKSYRTPKNTTICITTLWLIGVTISLPIGSLFTVLNFNDENEKDPALYCLLKYLRTNYSVSSSSSSPPPPSPSLINRTSHYSSRIVEYNPITTTNTMTDALPYQASVYWIGFVVFLYALPLICIVILYGLMLKFLRGAHGSQVNRSKRRATRMILAVVLTYATCWFSMQLLFVSNVILSKNTAHKHEVYMDILSTCANVFAYLNSCTNPILYGFMSKNFRSSFIDLLCCRYTKRHLYLNNESIRQRIKQNRQTNHHPSFVSRCSNAPLTNLTNNQNTASHLYTRPSMAVTELTPITDQKFSSQITVGTQTIKNKRQRKRNNIDSSYLDFSSTYKTRSQLDVRDETSCSVMMNNSDSFVISNGGYIIKT